MACTYKHTRTAAVVLGESQLKFRIGLARQRTQTYSLDSMDFIMMDLERPDGCRRFADFCTGDLTGRLLEFLSCSDGIDGKSDRNGSHHADAAYDIDLLGFRPLVVDLLHAGLHRRDPTFPRGRAQSLRQQGKLLESAAAWRQLTGAVVGQVDWSNPSWRLNTFWTPWGCVYAGSDPAGGSWRFVATELPGGRTRWTCDLKSDPSIIDMQSDSAGKQILLATLHEGSLMAIDAESGAIRWQVDAARLKPTTQPGGAGPGGGEGPAPDVFRNFVQAMGGRYGFTHPVCRWRPPRRMAPAGSG